MAAGALPPLVELLRDGSDEGKAKAAGVLKAAVVVLRPFAEGSQYTRSSIPVLVLLELARSGNEDVKAQVVNALCDLSGSDEAEMNASGCSWSTGNYCLGSANVLYH